MLPLIDLIAIATSPRGAIDARRAEREGVRDVPARAAAGQQGPALRTASSSSRCCGRAAATIFQAALEDDADRDLPRRHVRDRRARLPAREPAAARTARRAAESLLRPTAPRSAAPPSTVSSFTRPGDAVAGRSCRRVVAGSLAVLAAAVVERSPDPGRRAGVVVVDARVVARYGRYIGWPRLLAALILVILFIPIRRYSLPGQPAVRARAVPRLRRVLLVGWGASLLVDRRIALRQDRASKGRLLLIVASRVGSIVANPDRVAQLSSAVDKELMFFLSFVLVLYVTASVIRRLDDIDFLAKTLVGGGAVVALFAIVEARTGLQRLQPPRPRDPDPARRRPRATPEAFHEVRRREAARVRLGAASDRAQRGLRDARPARALSRAALPPAALVAVR